MSSLNLRQSLSRTPSLRLLVVVLPVLVLVAIAVVSLFTLRVAGDEGAPGTTSEQRREVPLPTVTAPPPPPFSHSDPDRSHGGYDIWMTRQATDGSWSVPKNLGPNVNTSLRETSAAVSHDGKWLYFASKLRPGGLGRDDIFVCERDGDGWGPAVNLGGAVNTVWEEIGACPLPDGKSLFFCRRDPRQRSYDLAITVKVEGEWLEAIGLGRPLATPGEERFPSITGNGRELFFTTAWRGGEGSYDIWQSYRDDSGNWSDPINLGPRVNSRQSDYSPGISPDGNRLFFASKRQGEAVFDLYLSERKEGGTWQDPVKLPMPVNTRFEEYCPSVGPDGKTLYFSSDRGTGTVTASDEE